jgi:hypothetical protein
MGNTLSTHSRVHLAHIEDTYSKTLRLKARTNCVFSVSFSLMITIISKKSLQLTKMAVWVFKFIGGNISTIKSTDVFHLRLFLVDSYHLVTDLALYKVLLVIGDFSIGTILKVSVYVVDFSPCFC